MATSKSFGNNHPGNPKTVSPPQLIVFRDCVIVEFPESREVFALKALPQRFKPFLTTALHFDAFDFVGLVQAHPECGAAIRANPNLSKTVKALC